jgi:hypothetical protein
MSERAPWRILLAMARFLLIHSHEDRECRAAFAAWRGFSSPLRHSTTIASCLAGGHEIWWDVEAIDADEALGRLPRYVAERTVAVRVAEVRLP